MTTIGIIAFTRKGGLLGRALADGFAEMGCRADGYLAGRHHVEGMQPFSELGGLTGRLFAEKEILIFVGACGIAVRASAPYIRHKMEDPGVIVVDECGKYVISLLSGHVGRANAFTKLAAQMVGGEAVITTATDRNGVFAVDEWAAGNGLRIAEPSAVKEISSRLLAGETVGFYSDTAVEGRLPAGLTEETGAGAGILVSGDKCCPHENRFALTCRLVPMDLVAGMGCRKGKSFSELDGFVRAVLERHGLMAERLCRLCSISDKEEEEGLKMLAKALRIPFVTYPADRLRQAGDGFASSDFVQGKVGVDNVCERSAYVGSEGGGKLIGKQVFDGMTLAVYQRKMRLKF